MSEPKGMLVAIKDLKKDRLIVEYDKDIDVSVILKVVEEPVDSKHYSGWVCYAEDANGTRHRLFAHYGWEKYGPQLYAYEEE